MQHGRWIRGPRPGWKIISQGYRVGDLLEICGKENAQDLLTVLTVVRGSSRGGSPGQPSKEENGRPGSPSE